MTDAEIVAGWMEKSPEAVSVCQPGYYSDAGWWCNNGGWSATCGVTVWLPAALNLDRLHLVEEWLSDEQWYSYIDFVWNIVRANSRFPYERQFLHADAAQKLAALAQVLRPEVEKVEAKEGE